jgi:hypothetical protein
MDSLTISRESAKYKLDLVGVQEVNGIRVVTDQQMIIHSTMEKAVLIVTSGKAFFLYIRES